MTWNKQYKNDEEQAKPPTYLEENDEERAEPPVYLVENDEEQAVQE